VLQRLRTGGYSYTLEPGVYGQHTADEFWFDRKEGFCEHIASSFVILMRALDVPARVVTGYQGGELNGVDGFWVVRNSDAHAWAEVWMDGRGWVRVDPTSSVAPGRTGSFQRLAAQQGLIAGALSGAFSSFSPTLLNSLRNTWEAVNNGWNQWVLNYSENKQLNLLKNIGFDSPSWEDLGYLLIGIIVFVSLCGAVWTLWEKSRHDPWLRLLERATARLQKAGFTLLPHSPPRKVAEQFSAQMAARRVDAAQDRSVEAIRQWFLRLEAWRYSSRSASHPASHSAGHSVPNSAAASAGKISLRELRRDLRQLPWPK
jgi:hypothetical protein